SISTHPVALTRVSETGGFVGSTWTRVIPYPDLRNITYRMEHTRRNDGGNMHDHLKMYKDYVVVFGTIPAQGAPHIDGNFLAPENQTYAHFICACKPREEGIGWWDCRPKPPWGLGDGDPPDGDMNMNIEIDRADLDSQPGFWTDGWFNDAGDIIAKLNDNSAGGEGEDANHPGITGFRNVIHCEAIIFGRDADDSNCSGE